MTKKEILRTKIEAYKKLKKKYQKNRRKYFF